MQAPSFLSYFLPSFFPPTPSACKPTTPLYVVYSFRVKTKLSAQFFIAPWYVETLWLALCKGLKIGASHHGATLARPLVLRLSIIIFQHLPIPIPLILFCLFHNPTTVKLASFSFPLVVRGSVYYNAMTISEQRVALNVWVYFFIIFFYRPKNSATMPVVATGLAAWHASSSSIPSQLVLPLYSAAYYIILLQDGLALLERCVIFCLLHNDSFFSMEIV